MKNYAFSAKSSTQGVTIEISEINANGYGISESLLYLIDANALNSTPQYITLSAPTTANNAHLTSVGRASSFNVEGTAWRMRNGTGSSLTGGLRGYGYGPLGTYDLPAKTDTYVVSPFNNREATHILTIPGIEDPKAAANSDFVNVVNNDPLGNLDKYTLIGSSFDDTLAGASANDTILGGDGDDLLLGLRFNDLLVGGNGNDTLTGGREADYLTGESGVDIFVQGAQDSARRTAYTSTTFVVGTAITFGDGLDFISDFTPGTTGDQLDLASKNAAISAVGVGTGSLVSGKNYYLSGTFNTSNGAFTIANNGVGPDTLIIQGSGGASFANNASSILLSGVNSADLTAANII